MKEETIPVVFRQWHECSIIALFPTIPADMWGNTCQTYEHIGQHGGADYATVIERTTVPQRYCEQAVKELRAELRQIGYALRVVKRATPRMHTYRRTTAIGRTN